MKNIRRWTLVVTALSILAARLVAHFVLGDVPHALEEIAYIFQAKALSSGHITAPLALPRAAFSMAFVADHTARYGVFPPGWPTFLAIGTLVHLRAWVNPVLHGLTTWRLSKSARKLGGPRARIISALVYGFSPQALFVAASFMPDTLVAFAAAWALWAGISANTEKPSRSTIAFGGVSVAIASLSNLTGTVVAFGFGLLLLRAFRQKKITVDFFVVAALPFVLGLLLLGRYERALGAVTSQSSEGVLQHGPSLGTGLADTAHDLTSWLSFAGGGPLVFLAPVLVIALARPEARARLMAIGVIVPYVILFYAFDRSETVSFGAHAYQVALPALLLIGALGLSSLDRFQKNATRWGVAAWLALSAFGFVFGIRELRDRYLGLDDRFVRLEQTWNQSTSVVMVAFQNEHVPKQAIESALTLDGDQSRIVFAKYHPGLVSELHDKYPNHAFYMYLMADLPANDVVERYDPSKWADPDAPKPADDFVGVVVENR